MESFICTTCGTGFAPSESPPPACAICDEERQFVPAIGQAWTTSARLRARHRAVFAREGDFLAIGEAPEVAIGQRAILVRTAAGNLLWDCIPLLDQAIVEIVRALGGLAGIAISHPHYYAAMVDWAEAFGDVPIHLHEADRRWVMRHSPLVRFWNGERMAPLPGLTLVRCGGHFAGGTVLHVPTAENGKGALLAGDILQVTADLRHVAFMRSFPNYLPLGAAAVRGIVASLDGLRFDAIYGPFWGKVVATEGETVLERSVARHIDWVTREGAAAWPGG